MNDETDEPNERMSRDFVAPVPLAKDRLERLVCHVARM